MVFTPSGGWEPRPRSLRLRLLACGHSVEFLLGKHPVDSIDPYWHSVYTDAGIQIRPAPPSEEFVEPWHFAKPHSISLGLAANPPDIVIAHDLGAPAYSALRLRQAGIAFENTLFVVFCHGTRRYIASLAPDVPFADLQTVLAIGTLEQVSVELAMSSSVRAPTSSSGCEARAGSSRSELS